MLDLAIIIMRGCISNFKPYLTYTFPKDAWWRVVTWMTRLLCQDSIRFWHLCERILHLTYYCASVISCSIQHTSLHIEDVLISGTKAENTQVYCVYALYIANMSHLRQYIIQWFRSRRLRVRCRRLERYPNPPPFQPTHESNIAYPVPWYIHGQPGTPPRRL